MELKLASMTNLRSAVPLSQWHMFVFATNSSIGSLTECGANCYLDTITPCHFYSYKDNTCYLGGFDKETDLVQPSSATADLYLNRGKKCENINFSLAILYFVIETMASYVHPGFLLVPSSIWYYEYSVKEFANTLNEDMCKIHCILDTTCHYSTYQPSSYVCQLGYYGPGTAINQFSNRGTLRTFINPNTVAKAVVNFYNFESADDIWPGRISAIIADIPHAEACASIAMLAYNLFYYNEDTQNCYLGLLTSSGSMVAYSEGSTTMLFFRKSK